MQFSFDINSIFKTQITKIDNNLLPDGFQGDRTLTEDVTKKVDEVITALGGESAKAQKLSQPITTGQKVKNQTHNVYILTDPKGKEGQGTAIGILKTGRKNLYLFDTKGEQRQVSPVCILDFYVHESQQRNGKGKLLFEYMLKEENIKNPVQMAIDRPSSKLLNFLNKHYGLKNVLPQSNKFVVYDGFFKNSKQLPTKPQHSKNVQTPKSNKKSAAITKPPWLAGEAVRNKPLNSKALRNKSSNWL